MACAILYPTPEAAAAAVHPSARIVMNLSPNRWPFDSPGYTDENGKNWYDFPAGDMGELFFDEAGDPVKNTLGTVQHEVTHLNTPPGNKHPKWIEEPLAAAVLSGL